MILKMHHLLRYVSHKDDESYQEIKKALLLFCRSLKVSKLATGFTGNHDNVLGRSSLQENLNLQNLCFFENSIVGT